MSRNTTFQRGRAQPATLWAWVAFLAAAWLAWAVRSLLSFKVFADDGSVLLVMGDSAYHARRALYSFVNFPDVLLRDPYMAYPGGSPIQFPPLYDWLLGGTARLFGDSERAFEGVVAWAAVFFATATLLPVFALGRRLYGPWVVWVRPGCMRSCLRAACFRLLGTSTITPPSASSVRAGCGHRSGRFRAIRSASRSTPCSMA